MNLSDFTSKYPPQPPRRQPDNPAQHRLLSNAEGVRVLTGPPADTDVRHSPRNSADIRLGCHLWAFTDAIPYVLETAPLASPALTSGEAKHTNLTGGQLASCGGEIWFDPADDDLIYVNGASGRYGPQTPQQLDDAVMVFQSLGFRAESFGWDWDLNRPARVLRT